MSEFPNTEIDEFGNEYCLYCGDLMDNHAGDCRDSYADYEGGKSQHDADLAILDYAAELSTLATSGEWTFKPDDRKDSAGWIYADRPSTIVLFGAKSFTGNHACISWFNTADAELIVNASRFAAAWARRSKWERKKGML